MFINKIKKKYTLDSSNISVWGCLKMTSWRGFNPGGLRDGRGVQISLPKDKEGMIGQECPQTYCEPKYFKISMNDLPDRVGSDLSNIQLFCPYCGTKAHMQTYRTKAQTDYAISLAHRRIVGEINNMFRGMIKDFNLSSPRGGWISLRLDYKPAILPMITKYIEKDLKRIVQCDDCGGGYAVYGVSNYCPWCGEGNLDVHFE